MDVARMATVCTVIVVYFTCAVTAMERVSVYILKVHSAFIYNQDKIILSASTVKTT